MISYVIGNLFESPAQTLVNTVNTRGVMGKGIALTFKRVYPEMFREYQRLCEAKELRVGTLFLYHTSHKRILNFPTKDDWRRPSKPEYIAAGLRRFREIYQEAQINSIAFPPLGCGNGELDFESTVRPMMEEHLGDLPIQIFIYAPRPGYLIPEHRDIESMRQWLRSEPAYLGFDQVWEDLQTLLAKQDTFCTLTGSTEFRALMLEDVSAVRVHAPGKTTKFTRDEVCELWQELRQHKLLTLGNLPAGRSRALSYLLPILAELEYVEPVSVGPSYSAVNSATPPMGIQLLPSPRAKVEGQLELV